MPNTSWGNTWNNLFAQLTVMTHGSSIEKVKEWIANKSFCLHLLGDDMWCQCTEEVYYAMKRGWEAFNLIGLPATGDLTEQRTFDGEFLRRRPYEGDDTIVMLPRPGRILQRAFVRYAGRVFNRHDTHYYAYIVAMGLRDVYRNTPVITPLLDRILDISAGVVDEYPELRRTKAAIRRSLDLRIRHWGELNDLSKEGQDRFRANYCITPAVEAQALREIESMTSVQTCLGSEAFHLFHEIDNHSLA